MPPEPSYLTLSNGQSMKMKPAHSYWLGWLLKGHNHIPQSAWHTVASINMFNTLLNSNTQEKTNNGFLEKDFS